MKPNRIGAIPGARTLRGPASTRELAVENRVVQIGLGFRDADDPEDGLEACLQLTTTIASPAGRTMVTIELPPSAQRTVVGHLMTLVGIPECLDMLAESARRQEQMHEQQRELQLELHEQELARQKGPRAVPTVET